MEWLYVSGKSSIISSINQDKRNFRCDRVLVGIRGDRRFFYRKGKGEKKEYESVHQVKNRKDNKMENYNEALSNIVKKIRDYPSIKRGFLHIKNEIITDNWKKEITDQMQNYYPQKIQELNAIVMKPELQKKIYDEILSMWNPNTHKINRRTNAMNKVAYR